MVSLGRRIVLLRLGRFGRHQTSKKIATMLSLLASQRELAAALCPHSIAAAAGRIQASTQVILVSFSQMAEGWAEEEEQLCQEPQECRHSMHNTYSRYVLRLGCVVAAHGKLEGRAGGRAGRLRLAADDG